MLAYTALLYQKLIGEGVLREHDALPPVLPRHLQRSPAVDRGAGRVRADRVGRGGAGAYQPSQRTSCWTRAAWATRLCRVAISCRRALETNRDRARLPALLGSLIARCGSRARGVDRGVPGVGGAGAVAAAAGGGASGSLPGLEEVRTMLAEQVREWRGVGGGSSRGWRRAARREWRRAARAWRTAASRGWRRAARREWRMAASPEGVAEGRDASLPAPAGSTASRGHVAAGLRASESFFVHRPVAASNAAPGCRVQSGRRLSPVYPSGAQRQRRRCARLAGRCGQVRGLGHRHQVVECSPAAGGPVLQVAPSGSAAGAHGAGRCGQVRGLGHRRNRAYHCTATRPTTPLLAPPSTGLSRRCASTPSSNLRPPAFSTPRP